ncbi:MAG: hypothetical protein HKL80_09445 [Acidimicrobiales bacterium]|nr:hypothetical protein [Acidimicrobiales bacterium]
MPKTSDVDWSQRGIVPNSVLVGLGSGDFNITVMISQADIIVEINGWFG